LSGFDLRANRAYRFEGKLDRLRTFGIYLQIPCWYLYGRGISFIPDNIPLIELEKYASISAIVFPKIPLFAYKLEIFLSFFG